MKQNRLCITYYFNLNYSIKHCVFVSFPEKNIFGELNDYIYVQIRSEFGPAISMKEVSSRLVQESLKVQEVAFAMEGDLQKQKEERACNGLSKVLSFLKEMEKEEKLSKICRKMAEGKKGDLETRKMIDQMIDLYAQEEEDERNAISQEGTLLEQHMMKFWRSHSRNPRAIGELAQRALDEVLKKDPSPGLAVELGCGNSGLVIELLKKNWAVVALDSSSDALKCLAKQINSIGLGTIAEKKLTYACEPMEEYKLPKDVSLNFGENSFHYSKVDNFERLWDRIHGSLKIDGCVGGNLWTCPLDQRLKTADRENGSVWYADIQMTKALLKDKGYDVVLLLQKGGWKDRSGGKIEFIGRKR